MKLRIRSNTLRLRLTRGEVDSIARGEPVVETTPFPGAVLGYELHVGKTGEATGARMDGQVIRVTLAASEARHWAQSNSEVSIRGLQITGQDTLELLVEKDFDCVSPRDGEESLDTFPNPKAHQTP